MRYLMDFKTTNFYANCTLIYLFLCKYTQNNFSILTISENAIMKNGGRLQKCPWTAKG